jgi:predicted HAD superfamily phosphohydrolase YqeG
VTHQKTAKIMIVEDEVLTAVDLEGVLMDLGHTVVGMKREHHSHSRHWAADRSASAHQPKGDKARPSDQRAPESSRDR